MTFLYTPQLKSGVSTPALPVLPLGMERYIFTGGKSALLTVEAGDKIHLHDVDGLQPVELVFFTQKAKKGNHRADGLEDLLVAHSFKPMLAQIEKQGYQPQDGYYMRVFDDKSVMGNKWEYVIEDGGMMMVVVPQRMMQPESHDASGEIIMFLQRQNPQHFKKKSFEIPTPLAEPLLDETIEPGNAFAYRVKKGQYIQIIDVRGRECSDFQAFSCAALDKGLEREICPTTTRTLLGQIYPTPGLASKYFTVDQEPLVRMVQDMCGRHDLFGIACSARTYEDQGYLGHVNCSDNINASLQPYSITARKGWPAVNFFFNTALDGNHMILSDEPWSRPGDHVIMQAESDLVCVSTACPSDIDPANAWQPSEIHLRIYDEQAAIKSSLGWRKTNEGKMEDTRHSPFHEGFAKHSRDFAAYNGYWMMNETNSERALGEYWACREKVAVMDLTPLRKYEVVGPDALNLLDQCLTRNIQKLAIGQVVYTAMCYEHGGMIDDGTLFRLGEHNYRWVGGNDEGGLWLREQALKENLNCWVRNSTEQLCNIAVQGPKALELLTPLFWTAPQQPSLDEVAWFHFTIARLGDFHGKACIISRTGYTGELGYELFCHPDDAMLFYNAIWQKGQEFGIKALGLIALNMLRIEAGLAFGGYEFCDQTDPFEAGIGFTVALKGNKGDFIGKDALLARKEQPQRKLVGLEIEGGITPVNGDPIMVGKAKVGEITSAVKSPILQKNIALARINVEYANMGSPIEIGQLDGKQKRLLAKITPFPHFDPQKSRVKGIYTNPTPDG